MENLPFPSLDKLPMSLKPARGGGKYFGSVTLKTTSSGHKQIEILLDTGETGTADVTYTPIRGDRGDIAAFNMTVYKADGTRHSQWDFGDITVDNSDGTIYVFSDTLDIDGVPFEMAGIPKTGKPATAPWLDVVEERVVIGRLFFLTVGPNTRARFKPSSGPSIAVTVNGDNISWVFNNKTYTGFRFVFGVTTRPPGAKVSHGYAGVAETKIGFRPLSVDDWEATLSSTFTSLNEILDADKPGFAFPTQSFGMVIAPPAFYSGGLKYNGTIRLSIINGQRSVTIQSGPNPAQAVAVNYFSSSAQYGVIGPFSVNIGGAKWSFAQITVFDSGGKTYLASYQLTIGIDPFSLSGLPLPVHAKRGRFDVIRLGQSSGTLVITSDTDGWFHPAPPYVGLPDRVAVSPPYVAWIHAGEPSYGFLFILNLRYSPQTVTPDFGYLGFSPVITESEDDWEATLLGPDTAPPTDGN